MSSTAMVWWCTSSLLFAVISVLLIPHTQGSHFLPSEDIPVTSFSCTGRHTGYYADMETGCQVYHMCGVGGRQFSYSCPNTTLFHQRMLICAHWYQVNCSRSEFHYDANLLIGQRDKPFVRDDEPKFFNYRKRLPSHGIQRTTEGGLAGDRGDGSTTSKSKPMTVDIRQFYNEWNPLVPTSTTVDTNTRPQHSVELDIQNNVLLPRFNLSDATVVYDRPASARSTTADYTKVNGNVPSQNSSATTDIRDGSAFINRFVLHEGVHNNSHTANGYKNIPGKDVDMYDFKIKDSSSKIPSLYLQPPHYNNEEENNKIELVFEDPRRVFYIADNGSDSVNSEPVLVTIRLNKSQMLFRNRHFCDKCHPLFIINKNTCTPCVVVR